MKTIELKITFQNEDENMIFSDLEDFLNNTERLIFTLESRPSTKEEKKEYKIQHEEVVE